MNKPMMIVWAVTESDYDYYSVNGIYEIAEDAFHAAGYFTDDGFPKYETSKVYYDVEAMVLYGPGAKYNENYESLADEAESSAYLSIYYIPAVVRKYEDGKKLDHHEKVAIGLIEPAERDLA